ncbi:MAG: hypothetical protein FRC54_05210 [bacterium LCO1.1]|uniref:Transposase n=1 Tax=Candidatus Weimeria bifida TaxID=2599074 RepID=A0A6N7IY93_9FIRM|nr:hypothetical protein [Candidatus Weimeria bifida]
MKNSNDITVAGCYSHVRRKFAEIVRCKKGEKLTPAQEIAAEAVSGSISFTTSTISSKNLLMREG